jgi:hypothetical protein
MYVSNTLPDRLNSRRQARDQSEDCPNGQVRFHVTVA